MLCTLQGDPTEWGKFSILLTQLNEFPTVCCRQTYIFNFWTQYLEFEAEYWTQASLGVHLQSSRRTFWPSINTSRATWAGTRKLRAPVCGVSLMEPAAESNLAISIIFKVKIWLHHLLRILRYEGKDDCPKKIGALAPSMRPPGSSTSPASPPSCICGTWWWSSGSSWNFSKFLFAPALVHPWHY